MKKSFYLILFIFFCNSITNEATGQQISGNLIIGDSTQMHVLITTNEDRFVGQVTKIENTTVYFLFQNKMNLEFEFGDIESIMVKGEEGYEDRYENPQRYRNTRKSRKEVKSAGISGEQALFYGPTAHTYGKKHGEYRNLMVFYNRINFGLSENIDLGVDFMPLIAINIVALKGKVGFPVSDLISVGVGGSTYMVFRNNIFNEDTFTGANHAYGVATIGGRDKFINLGFGYAFPINVETSFTSAPVINIGGCLSLNEKWKLKMDVILLSDTNDSVDFYAIGANWLMNPRNRLDFGITMISDTRTNFFNQTRTVVFPIPFAQYSYLF